MFFFNTVVSSLAMKQAGIVSKNQGQSPIFGRPEEN
jgi:hypothetical protein